MEREVLASLNFLFLAKRKNQRKNNRYANNSKDGKEALQSFF